MQLVNQLAREETIAQSRYKLMSGREMIRHIGAWVAVKSDHGQRYNINDVLALRLDDKNPNGDLYGFFFKWQDVYSAMFTIKDPDPMVMDAILDVFYRQMQRCTTMNAAVEKYNWDIQPYKQIKESYIWLVSAVQKNLNRDLTLHNQNEWELERHSRGHATDRRWCTVGRTCVARRP